MNKQELIERIEGLKNIFGNKLTCTSSATRSRKRKNIL